MRLGEDEVDGLTDDHSLVVLDNFAVNQCALQATLGIASDFSNDHSVLQQARFHGG